MIERIHLRILSEVDNQGSLTAAAEKLHLTQSALSHSIKKLEQQFAVQLWQKEGRKLVLTQAGEHLLRESRRLLPQLERLDETLSLFAGGGQGSLRIGMECHPCYRWLLRVVEPFLSHWPKVDVDVKQAFQFGGMAALFNHEIDILVTPDPLFRHGISFEPVFDYEQVLVVSTQHPFAARQVLTPQDLTEEILFTYPVETARLDVFKEFLIPANCSPRKHKVIEDTEIMLQMVAANRGVASLPRWLVHDYQAAMQIVAVRLGEQGIAKQIHLGIRDDEQNNSYTRAFVEEAKASQASIEQDGKSSVSAIS
jgi:LysR family transcriptional regulator for metE and metH